MKRSKIVLVATDFSEFADYATEHGVGIAKLLDYKIKILHVLNKKKAKYSEESAIQKLKNLSKKIYNKHQIKSDYILREGAPTKTIGEVASEVNANMVLIGTRGKTGVEYIFGSYALKIITNSPVPVIVVQKSHFQGVYKNIVMPLDFTVQSTLKAKWAIKYAAEFNSTVHILSLDESDEFYRKKLKDNIESVKKLFSQNDISYVESISEEDETSNFATRTIKYASKVGADLVMVMTNTGNFFLPSVIAEPLDEQFIFNASKIPTLCINPEKLNFEIDN